MAVRFISEASIKADREAKEKLREEKRAQKQVEEEEDRRERKRRHDTGEDAWVAPNLEKRLQAEHAAKEEQAKRLAALPTFSAASAEVPEPPSEPKPAAAEAKPPKEKEPEKEDPEREAKRRRKEERREKKKKKDKKKEKKKSKKDKKHKKHKKGSGSSSSDSGSGSESEPGEGKGGDDDRASAAADAARRMPPPAPSPPRIAADAPAGAAKPEPSLLRDSWMLAPQPSSRPKPAKEEEKKKTEEEPKPHSRELNPYAAVGYLPPEDPNKAAALRDAARAAATPSPALSTGSVSSAASWRQRAVQRARDEGRADDESLRERQAAVDRLSSTSDRDDRGKDRGRERSARDERERDQEHRDRLRDRESGRGSDGRRMRRPGEGADDTDEYGRQRRRESDRGRGSEAGRDGGPPGFAWERHSSEVEADARRRQSERERERERSERRSPPREPAPASEVPAAASAAAPPAAAAPAAPAAEADLSTLDPNKLAADLMKAELRGKTAEAARLKDLLERVRAARGGPPAATATAAGGAKGGAGRGGGKPVRVISEIDEYGRPIAAPPRDGGGDEAGAGPGAERARYFNDDDADVRTLLRREKEKAFTDYDHDVADRISRKKRFAGGEDDEYGEAEGGMEGFRMGAISKAERRGRPGRKQDPGKQEERQRARAVNATNRIATVTDRCTLCFDNPRKAKHLIVSIGAKAYLCVPSKGALVPGHCLIVPMGHAKASTDFEEDLWDEVMGFRRALERMFEAQRKVPVFLETCFNFGRMPHTFIECVPLPRRLANDAPMYFKQALMSADEEWATHKKVIDTRTKGLRRSIPKDFPYFHAEFGGSEAGGGFAHVIEDEKAFPWYFGREVLAGMLDMNPDTYMRPKKLGFEKERAMVVDFVKMWDPYDWTQYLEGGGGPERARELGLGANAPAPAPGEDDAGDAFLPGGGVGGGPGRGGGGGGGGGSSLEQMAARGGGSDGSDDELGGPAVPAGVVSIRHGWGDAERRGVEMGRRGAFARSDDEEEDPMAKHLGKEGSDESDGGGRIAKSRRGRKEQERAAKEQRKEKKRKEEKGKKKGKGKAGKKKGGSESGGGSESSDGGYGDDI